jgi:hypothetical protein
MRWDQLLAMLFMAGLTAGVWRLNRYHEHSGTFFAVPFSISRSRTPRLFRGSMILGWFSFALMVAFTLLLSTAFIVSWF